MLPPFSRRTARIRTAVVENRDVGGTCLNRGCIPTKTLMHTAELVNEMLESEQLELPLKTSPLILAEPRPQDRSQHQTAFRYRADVPVQRDRFDPRHRTITGDGIVRVASAEGERTFTADKILIATALYRKASDSGLDQEGVNTSDERCRTGPCI